VSNDMHMTVVARAKCLTTPRMTYNEAGVPTTTVTAVVTKFWSDGNGGFNRSDQYIKVIVRRAAAERVNEKLAAQQMFSFQASYVTADHYTTDSGEERNTPVFFADWVKVGNMADAGFNGGEGQGNTPAEGHAHAMPDDADDGW
jgi:hypothetical protein